MVDAPSIAHLNRFVQSLHFEQRPDRFRAPNAEAFQSVVERWLQSAERQIWLAEGDDLAPVGYVIAVRIDRAANALVNAATIVELDQVVVDPAARGRGIGTALCSEVLRWASTLAADRIELSTWSFNTAAQSLFSKLGFTPDFVRESRPTELPS